MHSLSYQVACLSGFRKQKSFLPHASPLFCKKAPTRSTPQAMLKMCGGILEQPRTGTLSPLPQCKEHHSTANHCLIQCLSKIHNEGACPCFERSTQADRAVAQDIPPGEVRAHRQVHQFHIPTLPAGTTARREWIAQLEQLPP